ncbi:hypothetical protein [Citricoccus alkalitolerans]|uniref:hypothetical protein n=1 Tax=Citricoccus alkalitolerans TaxID=246603 RepID=UPI0031E3F7E2
MSEAIPLVPEAQPTRRRQIHWLAYSIVGVLFLIIGIGIGSTSSGGTDEEAPQACLDYIDTSTELIGVTGDVISTQSEVIGIASDVMSNPFGSHQGSISRVTTLTSEIEDSTRDLEALAPEILIQTVGCQG